MAEKQMKLRVGELTDRDDFGRGIARIDSNLLKQLGVKEGDIIEVEGTRKSAAVAIRAYPVDIGTPVIRIDGLVRKNCGTGIGETIMIRKASTKEGRRVVLTPAERGLTVFSSPNLLKQNLYMRPMNKGDIVAAIPAFRRSSEADDDFGEEPMEVMDIFKEFFNLPHEVFFPFGTDMKLIVVESEPSGTIQITDNTRVELLNEVDRRKIPGFSPAEMRGLHEEAKEVKEIRQVPLVTYEDIGGIQDAVKKVREMIELPLRHPELFERLGVEPPKGVLLYGPPGTGKTLLAKAVANEAGAHFISLAGPEIMSKWYGQSEENLRKVFEEAQKNAPAIIFIDEIDAIAPKREEVTGEVERRVVSQLLTLMDGLKSRGKVIVLAATNRPNALDEALRRPGRFDREIDIGVPDKSGRKEILKIHTRNMPLSEDVNLEELAEKTYGYVGADLAALAREAAMSVIRRNMEEIKSKEEYLPKITEVSKEYNIRSQKDLLNAIKTVSEKLQKAEKDAAKTKSMFAKKSPARNDSSEEVGEQDESKSLSETLSALEIIKRLYVSMSDFSSGLLFVQPSAMREIMVEVPKVKWSDVGGLDEVKNALKEAVEWPLKNAESFKRLGIRPARGIMLYGPPGCGKTYIVKAVANEAGVNFISVKGPEVMSKWVGESGENIRKIFRKAKQVSPSIIFFDEIDAIAPRRGTETGSHVSEQIVSQLLTEMSGIEDLEGVAVIAATNRPDIIDAALLRPGRFDKLIYVPAPDVETRKKIFEIHMKSVPTKGVNIEKLAQKTEGYSGADLEAVVREAAMEAMRENMAAKEVTAKHFEEALKKIKPSITKDMFTLYQKAAEDLKKVKLDEEEKARYIG
ncbi:MAG: AAA family ATPase [Candidatus Aenigmatarchaeota archaeon]